MAYQRKTCDAPPFDLPAGARWASDPRPGHERWKLAHLMRWPWWRYAGQTTIYAGRHHSPVVYCDTEETANTVLRQRHPDMTDLYAPARR